jgi:hypothetical protein
MKVYERYWEVCDVLEAAGYSPAEAVTLATASVFPLPPAPDEVDLGDPCPVTSPEGGPEERTADGWYTPEDYGKAVIA